MVAIGSLNLWQPGRGQVITWTASPASREIMARADRDPVQPSFQQAGHLATAFAAREAGRQVPRLIIAAWNLDGVCDIAAMTEAINTHLRRHDTYHSAFDVSDSGITRRTAHDPAVIEFVPAALGFMEETEIRDYVLSSTPGTLEWDCFTFGIVQKADHFSVYACIDHLHTDGMSAPLIYRDITATYEALIAEEIVEGSHSLPQTAGYRDFSARQRLSVEAMTAQSRPVRDWADFARETAGEWPRFPLEVGGLPADGAGAAITIELLDAAQTEAFDAACRAAGARFSGGVMACAALADHRLTGAETFHTYTPSDTRSGAAKQSAGWYASLFPVSVEVVNGDFAQTARAAQKSFDGNKDLSAVPFARALELARTEEDGDQDGVAIKRPSGPSTMLSLFDFRKATDAEASGLGVYIDNLSHGDVNMWVARNAGSTIITVSFPNTPEARNSVHLYLAVLRRAFTQAAKLATDWIDQATDRAFPHPTQLAG